MTVENNDSDQQIQQQPLRENLINTAVAFLKNETVQKSPQSKQEAFLKRKGLTDEEVAVAFQRLALHQHGYNTQQQMSPAPPPHTSIMMPPMLPVVSPWSRFRDVGNTIALLTGLVYAVYLLYKRYVEPYIFKRARQKSKEDVLNEMKTELLASVDGLKSELGRVNTELSNVQQQQLATQCVDLSDDLRNLKSEVTSLKALLLSRNQFPTAVVNSPSIPSWQLHLQDDKGGNGESVGSASFSEPEIVHKNGSSDSSVDVLRD